MEGRWFEPHCKQAMNGCTSDGEEAKDIFRASRPLSWEAQYIKETELPIAWVSGSWSKFGVSTTISHHYIAEILLTMTPNHSKNLKTILNQLFGMM